MEEAIDHTYYTLIADYLDEKMSADEEIAFMEMVSSNLRLRELYEQTIDMGWKINDQTVTPIVIKKNSEALNLTNKFKKAFMYAAAILVLVAGLLVIKNIFNKDEANVLVENKNIIPDAPVLELIDSSLIPKQERKTVDYQMLFSKYFNRYQNNNNDPVELSYYYESYKNKRFAEVLNAKPEDYVLLGYDQDSLKVASFMNFYILIARFERGDKMMGTEFYKLSESTSIKEIRDISLWYSSLAFLNEKNVARAIEGFEKLGKNPNNPKRAEALEILAQIK